MSPNDVDPVTPLGDDEAGNKTYDPSKTETPPGEPAAPPVATPPPPGEARASGAQPVALDEPKSESSLAAVAASGLNDLAKVTIPTGIALITAVFVALGIQGDALSRVLRDQPKWVALAMALVVAGVTVPLLASSLSAKHLARLVRLCGAAVLAGTIIAIIAGISGVGDREEPGLELTGVKGSYGSPLLKVTATAHSMKPSDTMLFRIITFTPSDPDSLNIKLVEEACNYLAHADTGLTVVQPAEKNTDGPVVPGASVVYYGRIGPSSSGDISANYTVNTAGATYVCALALLSGTHAVTDPKNARFVTSVVTVSQIGVGG